MCHCVVDFCVGIFFAIQVGWRMCIFQTLHYSPDHITVKKSMLLRNGKSIQSLRAVEPIDKNEQRQSSREPSPAAQIDWAEVERVKQRWNTKYQWWSGQTQYTAIDESYESYTEMASRLAWTLSERVFRAVVLLGLIGECWRLAWLWLNATRLHQPMPFQWTWRSAPAFMLIDCLIRVCLLPVLLGVPEWPRWKPMDLFADFLVHTGGIGLLMIPACIVEHLLFPRLYLPGPAVDYAQHFVACMVWNGIVMFTMVIVVTMVLVPLTALYKSEPPFARLYKPQIYPRL